VPAFIALHAGLAAVNVVQTAYDAVQAITDALMAATPVGLAVIAIAPLAAGFVLAYNKLTLFHDAVNTAFVLLKVRVTVVGVSVGRRLRRGQHHAARRLRRGRRLRGGRRELRRVLRLRRERHDYGL
jgi:hypothetical protein